MYDLSNKNNIRNQFIIGGVIYKKRDISNII